MPDGPNAIAPAAWAAFALLGIAMAATWLPRFSSSPAVVRSWTWPLALALVCAVAGGIVNAVGLMILVLFAAACRAAALAAGPGLSAGAHAVLLILAAGLFTHALPGFDNPRVIDGVRLASDSLPYTKYLNFDKGVAGLLLLGLYAPTLTVRRSRIGGSGWAWRFALVAGVVIVATVAAGYARWDPKAPPWWPLWLLSMLGLTALPEEGLFRGVLQERWHAASGDSDHARMMPAIGAGVVFGLAHAGGGWTYVALAAIAGVGYGWIFAASGGAIGMAILTHTALNLLHLLFFSYPALAPS
jgi:membrane protease YdiL (CAAX protease family)